MYVRSAFKRFQPVLSLLALVLLLLGGFPQATSAAEQANRGLVWLWSAVSLDNAPSAREQHTAVWTGTEMIIWGGSGGGILNTGGRYNPVTDTWTPTSNVKAPDIRQWHTAVWTGTEMIVWGGDNGSAPLDTGGRYNPVTDTWTAMSTTHAPEARYSHTAVWTGTEMIVWGGVNGGSDLNTGGRYDPATDTWTALPTKNAPPGRKWHTAVWTGTDMIVWGGFYGWIVDGSFTNTGGRYNPVSDTWTAVPTSGAPQARGNHTAVWTDSEMIVWGGLGDFTIYGTLLSGGRYNPSTDTWVSLSTANAPSARTFQTAVWTGTGGPGGQGEMIVWGGYTGDYYDLFTGGRYNPVTDRWVSLSIVGAPYARQRHTAVWAGNQSGTGEMIIWGGLVQSYNTTLNTGGRYSLRYITLFPDFQN